jgi:hypothetical protein
VPTYRLHCKKCSGEFEMWNSIHDPLPKYHQAQIDPLSDRQCGGDLVQVYTKVSTYAVGERGRKTAISDATDREWSKDMDAYARFRGKGIQPPKITGCDRLEATAIGTFHAETGLPHKDEVVAAKSEEARAIARGMA